MDPTAAEMRCVFVELQEACGFLRMDGDRDFAGSLLTYYQRHERWTARQSPHAKRLADKAMQSAPRGFHHHIIGAL